MHWHPITGLQFVGKLLWSDGHRTFHQLWNIVALHELTVIVGVALGQLKGFRTLAVLVYVSDEGSGVASVIAATTEDHPSSVARPRVIALRVRRVNLVHGAHLASTQVHKIKVGLAMPDVEHTVIAKGEHEVAAIGRNAGEGDAL